MEKEGQTKNKIADSLHLQRCYGICKLVPRIYTGLSNTSDGRGSSPHATSRLLLQALCPTKHRVQILWRHGDECRRRGGEGKTTEMSVSLWCWRRRSALFGWVHITSQFYHERCGQWQGLHSIGEEEGGEESEKEGKGGGGRFSVLA